MKFSYYRKLSASKKKIYDRSDRITKVSLPGAHRFYPLVRSLKSSLESDDRRTTQDASQRLIEALASSFRVPPIRAKVLDIRPSRSWGEMHGLYEEDEDGRRPVITVWMRTAKLRQVVAFRTFLRTIVHEFMHHLDYKVLKLEDSLHTEGFYRRESALTRLLLDPANF